MFRDLLNISLNDFFTLYWEQHLIISKTNLSFKKLEDDLFLWDKNILEHIIITNEITMVKDSQFVKNDFFFQNEKVDLSILYYLYNEGFTLYIKNIHTAFPAIKEYVKDLELELYPMQVQTNLFISKGEGVGLAPHFDNHDIITIQLRGSKKWSFWKAFSFDMNSEYPKKEDLDKVESIIKVTNPIKIHTLKQYESLYIPRGVIHKPVSLQEGSTHMTFWLKAPLIENITHGEKFEKQHYENNYF